MFDGHGVTVCVSLFDREFGLPVCVLVRRRVLARLSISACEGCARENSHQCVMLVYFIPYVFFVRGKTVCVTRVFSHLLYGNRRILYDAARNMLP